MKNKIDWFDIYAMVSFDSYQLPLARLSKNIVFGKREFVLPDGTIAILPEHWFSEYKYTLLFGRENNGNILLDHKISKYLAVSSRGNKSKVPEEIDFSSAVFSNIEIANGFTGTLRSYQKKGVSWLYYISHAGFGCCLADDMGLGKTIETLAFLQKEYNDNIEKIPGEVLLRKGVQLDLFNDAAFNEIHPLTLIVMPTSLIHNWVNEIKKFVPQMKYYVHTGAKRIKNNFSFRKYDLILTSYSLIRNDLDIFKDIEFSFIILDESQVIKNPESKIFESLLSLKAKNKIIFTGTPIENSISDLWAQFCFINPGLLGELNYFKKEFIIPIEKNEAGDKKVKLKKLIYPFVLRRTKEEVESELPSLTEAIRYCHMTDEQSLVYELKKSEIRNFIFKEIENSGLQKKMFVVLKGLMQLRLISNHPVLDDGNYLFESGKFKDIIHHLETILSGNHKVLIFSSFVKHLNLFSGYFTGNEIPFEMLTGSTPEENRDKIINNFQHDDKIKIFLISIKAGGFGLNLTAADYVFILDPWWNPAVEMQAINRAHRIGQDKKVVAYKFITKDTIEEKILILQEKKKLLAGEFIGSNNPLRSLNPDEFRELFE